MASSFLRLQAMSAPHSGHTSAVKTSRFPSGAKRKAPTPPDTSVFFSASPPVVGRKKTWGSPARVERKARTVPSGEKAGLESRLSATVSARAFFPSASTRQRFVCRWMAGRSVVVTREGDAAAVGRDRGLGDALHAAEVGDRHGAAFRLCGERGGDEHEQGGGWTEARIHPGQLLSVRREIARAGLRDVTSVDGEGASQNATVRPIVSGTT